MLEAFRNPCPDPEILPPIAIWAGRFRFHYDIVSLTNSDQDCMRRVRLYWNKVGADYCKIMVIDGEHELCLEGSIDDAEQISFRSQLLGSVIDGTSIKVQRLDTRYVCPITAPLRLKLASETSHVPFSIQQNCPIDQTVILEHAHMT